MVKVYRTCKLRGFTFFEITELDALDYNIRLNLVQYHNINSLRFKGLTDYMDKCLIKPAHLVRFCCILTRLITVTQQKAKSPK